MPQDSQYITAKKLISGGYIKTLSELLDTIAPTRLAKDMGTHATRMTKILENPELFQFKDAYKIAALLEVDEKLIVDIIHNSWAQKKKKKR